MIIVELNNVSKAYGANTILQAISLKIDRGEKLGIIGENGCGKSTLLKMIAGTEELTEGAITKPKALKIGLDLLAERSRHVGREEVRRASGRAAPDVIAQPFRHHARDLLELLAEGTLVVADICPPCASRLSAGSAR